jgi:cell division protein ZapD
MSLSNKSFAKLFVQIQVLTHLVGRFGENIHLDPFLQSIRLIQSSHSIDGELHSPQLLLWLESAPEARQTDLERWLKQLKILNDTVSVYLSLFRETANFEPITLIHGFYQCSLPTKKTSCQLIMLRMDKYSGLVPKMQIAHHGFSLRLCQVGTMCEVQNKDIAIDLSICQL